MIRLQCPRCGGEVFFDSLDCVSCHVALVLWIEDDGAIRVGDTDAMAPCAQRGAWWCNWVGTPSGRCRACELVDVDEQTSSREDHRLVDFLRAERRALRQLSQLGIAWIDSALRFHFAASSDGDEVTMGHANGVITLELDEGDPLLAERARIDLNEPYRTPLGHVRHELGHFVWMTTVERDDAQLAAFREVFGDDRVDYQQALESHYRRFDDGSWRGAYVSFYASSHPWEDFAESWAHLLHVVDVVETATSWRVIGASPPIGDVSGWLEAAAGATVAANELARAVGMRDVYPFVLSAWVRRKIEYCWSLTSWSHAAGFV